ncbi:MAG: magnesium transporter [Chloroflexaceae bacterium]
MIAFRTAAELDLLRPTIVRVHEVPAEFVQGLHYAPAMSFPQYVTVEQTVEALREMTSDTDSIYYLFVTNIEEHLVGVVSLHKLLMATPETKLYEIMDRRVITLSHDATLQEQAHILSQSGLLALPVVDEKGRLVGAMDACDLITAIQNDATAQMYQMAGVAKDETVERPLVRAIGQRFTWLSLNLLFALLVVWLVSTFSSVIAGATVLAAFLPLIVIQGSKAATQTLSFIVRSLTLGEVRLTNLRPVLRRELLIGISNGLGIGLLAGLIGWMWQGSAGVGLVVGGAMLGDLLLAALVGLGIPLLLKALRINPARVSTSFVTTLTSVGGLALLLGLGTLALHLGLL